MKRGFALVAALLLAATTGAQAQDTNAATPAPPASTAPAVASDFSHPDRSCKVDADCQVKNVGNCCGAHPECVNKDAPTDPAKVRAQCAGEHRFGTCNVRAVSGCSCVQGQCAIASSADTQGH